MEELDLAGVTRLLNGEEEPVEYKCPVMEDHQMIGGPGPSQDNFFDGGDQKPFDPDMSPRRLTNNLDLTGIAYDFPEDVKYPGMTIESGAEFMNLEEQMPHPVEDAESDDVQIEEDMLQDTYGQLASLEDFMEAAQEPVDHWPDGVTAESLVAMNEAYTELITCMMTKVDLAINANKEKQARLSNRIQMLREAGKVNKRKVPVLQYLPPYFKDENMMCPPLSSEARLKQRLTDYDPLMKEERKWSAAEINQLKKAVRDGLISLHLEPLIRRKRELDELIKSAGQEVAKAEVDLWMDERESIARKESYATEMTIEALLSQVDARNIDWTAVSNINFNGMRTAMALELKWMNEVAPRWNHDPWTAEEVKKLKKIRQEDRFVSWAVLADRLGTRRTPWQCFSKYKRDIQHQSKEWTQEEDEKLIALCSMMQMNGNVNWDKVTYYMPGRNRQQVRVRYMRTLDKNVKHGKWSEQEDLLLMCAVNRLGAQDWSKIAKAVGGRTDTQCRERWVNVLDRRVHPKEWNQEEDEKLLFLMSVFGNNAWSKCASFLNSRSGDQCRYRYQSLMNSKIRLCMAKNISAKDVGFAEYNSRISLKKIRVNRLYQKFNTIMRAVAETPEERGMNYVHEDLERSDTPKGLKLTDDDRQAIDEEMQEIERRHKEGNGADQAEILNCIQISQSDLNNYVKRKDKLKKINAVRVPGRTKGRKVRLAKAFAEKAETKKRYKALLTNKNLSEEEVIRGQYEVLMDTVSRHDGQEWSSEFQKIWKDAGGAFAEDFTREILTARLEEQTDRLADGGLLDNDDAMPPSYSNCDFLNLIERVRPRLMKDASFLFQRSDVALKDPAFAYSKETRKFTPADSLNLKVTEEVRSTREFLALKAIMRNALIEPMMYEHAVGNRARFANIKKINLDKQERDLEEQRIHMGLDQRPYIEFPKKKLRTIIYSKDEENMPIGQWLVKKEEPQDDLPPIPTLMSDEELVEEQEPEIDVTGSEPNSERQDFVPGPSSATPAQQTKRAMPSRKRRNSTVTMSEIIGVPTDEKQVVLMDNNDDTTTPSRPVAPAARHRSSFATDNPRKKRRNV